MDFDNHLTLHASTGCSFIAGTNSFRTAWAIQFIPCFFLLAGLPFLPRSPRWLAKVERVDEAIEILARIQAGGDVNDPLVVAEWEEITAILAAERGKRRIVPAVYEYASLATLKHIFHEPHSLP